MPNVGGGRNDLRSKVVTHVCLLVRLLQCALYHVNAHYPHCVNVNGRILSTSDRDESGCLQCARFGFLSSLVFLTVNYVCGAESLGSQNEATTG